MLLSLVPPTDPEAPVHRVAVPLTDPIVVELGGEGSSDRELYRLDPSDQEVVRVDMRQVVDRL